MDARKLKITLLFLLVLGFALPAQAQTALTPLAPVTGEITPGGTNAWTFSAQSGAVLSFTLDAQSDDFDAALTLSDSNGREIIASDDYDYPASLNPLLEAVAMPYTGSYTLTVSGFNGTSGGYTLTMLPGYSVSAYNDDFSEGDWAGLDATATVQQADGQLTLNTQGTRQTGIALATGSAAEADFYAQAQVVSVVGQSGWSVGMAMRRQGHSYYLYSVNSDGLWRFTRVSDDSETIIKDWTPHPAIVTGASSFSLGVLARGAGFDFFYNGSMVGSSSDSTLTGAGQIGLMVGTSTSGTSAATFDNLSVTTPAQDNGAGIIPQTIQQSDGNQTVQALRRMGMVSALGKFGLTIPDSSVEYARPGINRVMLGRGTQYQNFALGATVNLSAAAPGPAGCGLVFRFTSDTDYTLAYINATGEYGLSKRTGDTFAPGIYGQNPGLSAGQHLLLVVANDTTIDYYVDRQLVGSVENSPQAGEVGIAVVNFEPNSTSCRYSNLWLWNWS